MHHLQTNKAMELVQFAELALTWNSISTDTPHEAVYLNKAHRLRVTVTRSKHNPQ